jgi:hypothetical protein
MEAIRRGEAATGRELQSQVGHQSRHNGQMIEDARRIPVGASPSQVQMKLEEQNRRLLSEVERMARVEHRLVQENAELRADRRKLTGENGRLVGENERLRVTLLLERAKMSRLQEERITVSDFESHSTSY